MPAKLLELRQPYDSDDRRIAVVESVTSRNTLIMIKVFYTPKMVAIFENYSPSPAKPIKVVESWEKLGFPIEIVDPIPATKAELCLAHENYYVDGVLNCTMENGFGNMLKVVADSLPYTVGSMVSAAKEAVNNGKVAVAPCSGFHHAGIDWPQGFCTFNGLAVAACVLKKEGLANKVGILDFDMHYGNGTTDIIKKRHLDWITHISAGAKYYVKDQADEFLGLIPKMMNLMSDCNIILYQAGADPHIDDPLGGWLTTEQLAERDQIVFTMAKRLGIPIAWNLAGGYQVDGNGGIRPVLDIHNNTMKKCHEIYQ